MERLLKYPAFRRFLNNNTSQVIAGAVLVFIAFVITASIASILTGGTVPKIDAIMIACFCGTFGYFLAQNYWDWIFYLKEVLHEKARQTIQGNEFKYYLKDPKLQVQMENEHPGFGVELQRVCELDFCDDSEFVWLDFEKNKRYYHVRIRKDAVMATAGVKNDNLN